MSTATRTTSEWSNAEGKTFAFSVEFRPLTRAVHDATDVIDALVIAKSKRNHPEWLTAVDHALKQSDHSLSFAPDPKKRVSPHPGHQKKAFLTITSESPRAHFTVNHNGWEELAETQDQSARLMLRGGGIQALKAISIVSSSMALQLNQELEPGRALPSTSHYSTVADSLSAGWGHRLRTVALVQASQTLLDYDSTGPAMVLFDRAMSSTRWISRDLGHTQVLDPPEGVAERAHNPWKESIRATFASMDSLESASGRFARRWALAVAAEVASGTAKDVQL